MLSYVTGTVAVAKAAQSISFIAPATGTGRSFEPVPPNFAAALARLLARLRELHDLHISRLGSAHNWQICALDNAAL